MSKCTPWPESSSLCCWYSCSTHPSTPQTKHVSSPERCVTDVCEEVVIGQEKNPLLKEKIKMFAGENSGWPCHPPPYLKPLGFHQLCAIFLTSYLFPNQHQPASSLNTMGRLITTGPAAFGGSLTEGPRARPVLSHKVATALMVLSFDMCK